MLFNELYNSIRNELLRVKSEETPSQEIASTSAPTNQRESYPTTGANEDPNSGDKYLFQLLRLLYTVSNSSVPT